jgi:hypothetical protein
MVQSLLDYRKVNSVLPGPKLGAPLVLVILRSTRVPSTQHDFMGLSRANRATRKLGPTNLTSYDKRAMMTASFKGFA